MSKCVAFESTLLNYICANHYSVGPSNTSQWQQRRKEATEQIKNPALAGSRTQVSATLGPRAYRYATGAVTTWVFILLSFPVLKFTPPPSLRVDFCSRHVVNSVFVHNCPLLISLYNIVVLVKMCRFWINVASFLLCCHCEVLEGPTE